MTTKVTSEDFAGLVNPYTGKPMEVYMTVNPGADPLFRAPDTYSTGQEFPTREECIREWDRANGIYGVKTGKPVRCAYTGKLLSPVQTVFGWKLVGGFDPHLFYRRDAFLRLATMRDGVVQREFDTSGRVTATPPRGEVTGSMRRSAEAKAPTLDEAKIHEIEERVKSTGMTMRKSVRVSKGGRPARGR